MRIALFSRLAVLLDRAEALGKNPWALFVVLFALDALLQPYAGIQHDAQLYAVQVMNHLEGGLFNRDLHFLYGSQDSYSLFSAVMAPLARSLGIFASFLLGYLASRGLFLYGTMRLTQALVQDRRISTLALIFLAFTGIPYGGLDVFHVNERFLTPRLLASALALLGLEQMLARRYVRSLGFLLLSMLLHPLMACGGLLVFVLWTARQLLSFRLLLALVGVCAAGVAGILFSEPLGLRLFGPMDEVWRDLVRRRSPHCFPAAWELQDWLRIGGSFFILLAAARRLPRPLAAFCRVTAAAGALGLGGSFLAAGLPYALLLQGQPFRVLWFVQYLAIPLGFFLASRWATDPRPAARIAVLLLLIGVIFNFTLGWQTTFYLVLGFPVFVLLLRGFSAVPEDPDWLWLSALGSILFGALIMSLTAVLLIAQFWGPLVEEYEPLLLAWCLPHLLNRVVLFLLCLFLALKAGHWLARRKQLGWVVVSACLAYQVFHFAIAESDWYCRTFRKDYASMRFIQQFLAREPSPGRRARTVYWATDIKNPWLYLRVNSYFHLMQTPGNIFSRKQALEGDRRARLVARFEIQHMRAMRVPGRETMSDREWRLLLANFHTGGEEPPPGPADLDGLCREEDLDYVISKRYLGPGYCRTNGEVFIYEARNIVQARADRGFVRR